MSTIEELKNLQYVPAGSLTDSAPPVSETVLYWEAGEQITASKLNQIDYGVSSATQAINDLATYLDNEITTRSSEDTRVAQQEAKIREAYITAETIYRQTADEKIQNNLDAEIENRKMGFVNYGSPSFTDVTMTRQGVRVVWNYTFPYSSTATKYVPTGEGIVDQTPSSSIPGLVLEDGHIYRLRADYVSGSATNDVSVIWSTSGAYSRIAPSYSVANGDYANWYTDLTYSTDEYPNGVWPILFVFRGTTGGNKLVNYTVDFYIEDITEDVEQSVRHGGDIGLNGLVDYGRGPLQANTGITNTNGINLSAVGDGMDLVLDTNGDQMGGGTVAAYGRLNGGFKYYNTGALLAKSGDAKVRLTNGHKYRLLTRYVSGDWLYGSGQESTPTYARAFSVTGTGDDAALSSLGTAEWAPNGRDIVCEFEYNEGTDYPDGIYIGLFIRRTSANRCTFDGYHIHITLEDLTEPGTHEVCYDIEQVLTDEQKAQARKNIGAENASAVRIIPNVVGYVAANATAVTVEVDENGIPINAGSSTTTVRYIVLPCSPGDKITVRSPSPVSNNTRNWMMLGAVDTSTTPNTRPILAKHKNAATPTVFTAPAGTELIVFASTTTLIANDTDRYWMGGLTEARLDALEVLAEPGVREVRYDTVQALTDEQKAQARRNIATKEDTAPEIMFNYENKYIALASADATSVSMENDLPKLTSQTNFYCYLDECAPGDVFTVKGVNRSATIPGFLFIAEDGTILTRGFTATSAVNSERKVMIAPENAKFVYLFTANGETANNKLWRGANTDAPFNFRGSALTIDAVTDGRYTCGTLSSLSFTPCSSGLCEVEFTSGTTATTLQVNGVTWPSWFDPNHLSTSTIYDIMIKDGHLGAVMVWPA